MAQRVGIIAEDMSDVDVIKLLAKKVCGKNFYADQHVGKGCGPLLKKAPGWCRSLLTKGCTKIILVHDKDRNDAAELRRRLETALNTAPQIVKTVIIPEEELEAWLLSDTGAIERAMRLNKKFKIVHHPETVQSPKEYIRDEIYKLSEKKVRYVNSVHNKLIATELDVNQIINRCPSFEPFHDFFKKI